MDVDGSLGVESFGICKADWQKISAICQAILGSNGQIITLDASFLSEEDKQPEFCKYIQTNFAGKKACRKCHAELLCHLNSFPDVIDFKCHAGLNQFVIPFSEETAFLGPGVLLNSLQKSSLTAIADTLGLKSDVIFQNQSSINKLQPDIFLSTANLIKNILCETFDNLLRSKKRDSTVFIPEDASEIEIEKSKDSEDSFGKAPAFLENPHKKNRRRVVVTGLGIVSSIGNSKEEFTDALYHGKNGIKRIDLFDPSKLSSQIAGQVVDFNPLEYMDRKRMPKGRSIQFAVAAARMAFEDAGLSNNNFDVNRTGVSIGSSTSGMEYAEEEYARYIKNGRVGPILSITMFGGATSSEVSLKLGVRGQSVTIGSGCAASTDAIGYATRCIQDGNLDIMVAGGTEALITRFIIGSFCSLRVLSKRNDDPAHACRPFDKDRDGMVVSEGSGILILEELNHALARKAKIYGEILGYGATGDAYHMTRPEIDGKGAAMSMENAVHDSGIDKKDIDYISAHGTSTFHNDIIETKAIKKVFGKYVDQIPVSAIKSMTGHGIGASGSIELVGVLLAMQNGFIPPTINLETHDPECDLDYVPNSARKQKLDIILKNSLAFGGKNASLVVGRY